MKSWLNSFILNGSGFSFKSSSVREQILLIQSKNDPFSENLIEMHDFYRQTWFQLFQIQNLKTPMSFCLNMLKIWIQTILVAKWSEEEIASKNLKVLALVLHQQ